MRIKTLKLTTGLQMTAHKMYNKCLRFCFVSAFFCLLHSLSLSLCCFRSACFSVLSSVCVYVLLIAAMNFSRLAVDCPLAAVQSVNSSACSVIEARELLGPTHIHTINARNDTFMMCTVALTSFFAVFFVFSISFFFFFLKSLSHFHSLSFA